MQESDMMTEGESRTRSTYRNDSKGHSVMTIDQISKQKRTLPEGQGEQLTLSQTHSAVKAFVSKIPCVAGITLLYLHKSHTKYITKFNLHVHLC